MEEATGVRSNRWLTTLQINENISNTSRDKIIEVLEKRILNQDLSGSRCICSIISNFEYVKLNYCDVSAELFENGLCLPSGSNLTELDQNRIIDIILSLAE